MNPNTTLAIEITSVKRTSKRIEISWTQGEASFNLAERDNPLPQFVASLNALVPLVCTICHFSPTYAEHDLSVSGFVMGEQSGTPTILLTARKGLPDAGKEFIFRTPPRMLGIPTEEGSYTPPLCDADKALVWEAVEQAKSYVRGDRAQGQIQFETGDDGDDFDGGADDAGDDEADTLPLDDADLADRSAADDSAHADAGGDVAATPAPKRRGRPKGAKNKAKSEAEAPAAPEGAATT